ncbi:putative O-methyltransferase [Agromyces rhizosphaerae]|uniref:O-methyltransferase n=1 Tax=Agromyces rhizosphaerae TaxID=88374 RepID=A0A9W6D028_9MICO|nr:class I SAM-dependent methyltransferase [Agromyces rhizosphaerae]GLI28419.1 putative O-methyltransferase [Agromyces rhizosphaerae]
MSDHDLNWKFADETVVEPEAIARVRLQSLELGIDPVSPAVGAQLSVLTGVGRASSIIEIGTGVGVSGLWLLAGNRHAHLTSIDSEAEYHQHARENFADAGIAPTRTRFIAGRAGEVLPRMNENSYDIVLVDADPESAIEYVEHALRLALPGGAVLVARALWKGRVADPARRDPVASGFRTLISELAGSNAVATSLSPAGEGLLQIVKLGA